MVFVHACKPLTEEKYSADAEKKAGCGWPLVTNSTSKRNRLKRDERLKSSTRIGYILRNGGKIRGRYISLYSVDSEKPAFAVLVKKKTGNSVQRNRVKRWVREIYRQKKHEIQRVCQLLILVDKSFVQLDFQKIQSDLTRLLQDLNRVKKHEDDTTNTH